MKRHHVARVAAVLIVKNEAHCVLDALESVRPVMDHWVIVDTGSTDATRNILRRYQSDVPGFLHKGPFIDFSQARNLLLDYAEPTADWLVILDADMAWQNAELLRAEIERVHSDAPEVNGLAVEVGDAETYWQVRVFRTGRGWRYRYRTHELAVCPSPTIGESASRVLHFATGGSRQNKPHRDLSLLELDLADHPNDPVTHYYLAGTLRALNRPHDAIRHYRKAIALSDDPESEMCYISLFAIAEVTEQLGLAPNAIEEAYLDAAALRPGRREALARVACLLNQKLRFQAVLELDQLFSYQPLGTRDRMFVRPGARSSYHFELARAAHALGDQTTYQTLYRLLKNDPNLSSSERAAFSIWPAAIPTNK